jgi:hypothetical protein
MHTIAYDCDHSIVIIRTIVCIHGLCESCAFMDCANGPAPGLTVSPSQLMKEWNRSVHLIEGLEQAKAEEEQNPDFDTDGAELKRPIHGPEVSFSWCVRSGFQGFGIGCLVLDVLGVGSLVVPANIRSGGMLDQPLTSLHVANKGSCVA